MANVTSIADPLWISRDSTAGIGNTSLDARVGMGGLADPSTSATFGFASGVYPGSASGTTILDCAVSAGSGMSVNVAAGNYQCGRSGLGVWLGAITGSTSVSLNGSNGSNPRIDYVVLRVREPVTDGTITASAYLVSLPGTPSASPSEGTAAGQMLDGDLLLAAVTVRAGTTSILTSDISDRRSYSKARGGIGVKSATDNSNGSYPGEHRWNLSTSQDEVWTGAAWVPIATPGTWNAFTPVLYNGGDGVAQTPGSTQMGLGSGSSSVGRYLQIGKRLDLSMTWTWGTGPFNGGTGDISTRLPAGFLSRASGGEQHYFCHLFTLQNGNGITWPGQVFIRQNTNVMWFSFPFSASVVNHAYYRVATQQGVGGNSIPNIPGAYAEGGNLSMSCTVEIA